MNRVKSTTAFCTALVVTLPVMTFAASGVIELEIPGMNPVTAAAITDFTTNPCPETVEAIRWIGENMYRLRWEASLKGAGAAK